MNIKGHSKHIASHPYTQQAFTKYLEGDFHDLEHLFFEIQIHLYIQCCSQADRTYRKWKDLQPAEIRRELKAMPAPEDLYVNLPSIPKGLIQKPIMILTKPVPVVKRLVTHHPKEIPTQYKLWPEVA